MHCATGTPPPILLLIVLALPLLSFPPSFLFESSKKDRPISKLQVDPLFSRRRGLDQFTLPEGRRVPEVLVRFPRRALAGRHLFHHLVDLLEGEAPRLRHEEVGPEDAAAAQPAPDEEHFRAEVAVGWVDHVGDDDAWVGVSMEFDWRWF